MRTEPSRHSAKLGTDHVRPHCLFERPPSRSRRSHPPHPRLGRPFPFDIDRNRPRERRVYPTNALHCVRGRSGLSSDGSKAWPPFPSTLLSRLRQRQGSDDATIRGDLTVETQAMNLFEIEIGRRYKYHHRNGQYFVTVKAKQDGRIGVVLEEEVGAAGDPGDPIDGLIWLRPEDIHPV
jgi:hypothetical protein